MSRCLSKYKFRRLVLRLIGRVVSCFCIRDESKIPTILWGSEDGMSSVPRSVTVSDACLNYSSVTNLFTVLCQAPNALFFHGQNCKRRVVTGSTLSRSPISGCSTSRNNVANMPKFAHAYVHPKQIVPGPSKPPPSYSRVAER